MTGRLALFDLDNTLLAGDSDHAWGEFLISRKLVDEASHRAGNEEFYRHYQQGRLDIHAWVKFTLTPILECTGRQRERLRTEFTREVIAPMVQRAGRQLVARHQRAGDCCIIITATNDFITAPIARLFSVKQLLATQVETINGRLTGRIAGIPCYRDGKVQKLEQWLGQRGPDGQPGLHDSIFYSDSSNDLPLLERVSEPVAVDPDPQLKRIARERGWKTVSLRGSAS